MEFPAQICGTATQAALPNKTASSSILYVMLYTRADACLGLGALVFILAYGIWIRHLLLDFPIMIRLSVLPAYFL